MYCSTPTCYSLLPCSAHVFAGMSLRLAQSFSPHNHIVDMKRVREEAESKEDQGLMKGQKEKENEISPALQDVFTPVSEIPHIVNSLRQSFQNEYTFAISKRKEQLIALRLLIDENKGALARAIEKDMGRHPAYTVRIIGGCVQSTELLLNKLDEWSSPRSLPSIGESKCEVRYAPRGVALIIGTWNFPNPLVWKPLASALAAGNTVLVKLSEYCEHSSLLMQKLIARYLDPRVVRVVMGSIPEVTETLKQRFDVIFYTGSTGVGKIVMAAAAKHLTPCILELGGKNPVVVSRECNIPVAARKIVDGRFKNTGQFCVAPDYVLCDEEIQEQLVAEMKQAVVEFFTENPRTCDSFGRIISTKHAARIAKLLEDHDGDVVIGGDYDVNERYIAPTIVNNPSPESSLMQDEVFGPILPVVGVTDYKEAVSLIHTEPLALYIFARDQDIINYVIDHTRSGGVCVNDVIVHMLNETLPFGGLGRSGMGNYHGEFGFKAFSHEKGVLLVSAEDTGAGRYPPYQR